MRRLKWLATAVGPAGAFLPGVFLMILGGVFHDRNLAIAGGVIAFTSILANGVVQALTNPKK